MYSEIESRKVKLTTVFKLEGKYKLKTEVKCKDFDQNFIRTKFKRPISENTWQEKNKYIFDNDICKNIH